MSKKPITKYEYDNNYNRIKLTNPRGKVTTYTYDRDNRLISETDPLGNTKRYNYNRNNNLTKYISNLGNTTSFEYDIDNNRYLYQIIYPLPWSLRFESGHNVFEKMSIKQMTTFKEKVDKLVNDLQTVQDEPDLVKQCKKLRDIFGDSFSIPEAKEVSKTQMNYIPRSTASGFGR